jgi:hypothetical protein
VDLKFRGWLLGVYFGLHGGNGRLGLLACDRARNPNSAEKFERYMIFLGLADNSDISDFSPKFRRNFFPCLGVFPMMLSIYLNTK